MVLDTDYEVLAHLGEGAFGKVYKAQHKKTGDAVAVKQIKVGSRTWDEACRSSELQALKALRHPFIVRLRELIRSPFDGSLYYIFEFIDSDLCRLVKAHPGGLEEMAATEMARQLFAGVTHMHQHNFFHRDLKPENILLETERNSIRIADLGQARSLRARPPFTDYVGTRWYRAPECLLRDRCYSSPVDVWASGLIFAELLRGSALFCGTSTIDQLYKIFTVLGQPVNPADWPQFAQLAQAVRFRVPERSGVGLQTMMKITPQAHSFLTEILTLNPYRRPLAKKCLEHAFFLQLPPLDMLERLDTHRSRGSDAAPQRGGSMEDLGQASYTGGAASGSDDFGAALDYALAPLEVEASDAAGPPPAPSWMGDERSTVVGDLNAVAIEELDAELEKILSSPTPDVPPVPGEPEDLRA